MHMDTQGAEQELKQVEISIELAKKKVALGECLERLLKNPDFKKLFMEEYLKDYAVHLVKNKASMGMQDDANQKFIDAQINAIGNVDQFLRFTSMEAYQAKMSLTADEQTMEEILEEEA